MKERWNYYEIFRAVESHFSCCFACRLVSVHVFMFA
jgi:hypothetical protein